MPDANATESTAPLTPGAARARHEAMCRSGTSAHSRAEWLTMGALLVEAGIARPDMALALRDRAADCATRAMRAASLDAMRELDVAAYTGCLGAGFRTAVAS